jgi:Flp pilus assembly protein TadB
MSGRPPVAAVRAAWALLVSLVLLALLPAGIASARTQSPGQGSPRVAMIVFDVSKALSGVEAAAERQAALRYARALPPDVSVGLVTFSSRWQVALPPAADRGALVAALNASRRAGGNAVGLYGALAAAESAVRAAGGGAAGSTAGSRLLLLSKAEDVPSRAVRPALPVDVIVWHNDDDDNVAALHGIAAASRGRVTAAADSVALAKAFPRKHPATGARQASPSPAPGGWQWKLAAVLACVFAALLLIGLLLTGALRAENPARRLEAQLDRHYTARQPSRAATADGTGEGRAASAAVNSVERLLGAGAKQRLALRLDLAGISRKPADVVVLGCCGSVVLAVLLTLLSGSPLLGVLVGALAGWLAMRLVVSVRISRRRAAFAEQLPNVLQILAGSLQSGFSLPQALDAVIREDTQPVASEFSRALLETRIGGELETALDRVADRMDSKDLRWAVIAIRIQRSVGGNLVEVLRTSGDTMRERAAVRRHVRALSAEGRLSAYILIALPVLIGAWLFLTRDSYMRPLYTTPLGLAMLTGAVVLVVAGAAWMRNVVKVVV